MIKKQASKLIGDVFNQSFDREQYQHFLRGLLNEYIQRNRHYTGNLIPEAYKQHVNQYWRLGKYVDPEGEQIDLLVVEVKNRSKLERARTALRTFAVNRLDKFQKQASLIAFYAKDDNGVDWRFSFVKIEDTAYQHETGKVKLAKDITPAKRYSFLVGEHESSHTAQSRLVNFLENDRNDPTLEEIENAFNVETVTKEFFLEYRDLFLRTKEALDKIVAENPEVKADFEKKDVDTVNFAKKLLGQIVFLYFLQKKGWFGVGRNKLWGDGPKNFLRQLFDKKHGDYANFFNDILEPLFYEALRMDRGHDDNYYSRFNCKIPFLNGGLFDPIGNYSWYNNDILLPNSLFSNSAKTKAGDTGTGILDIFDRYNFTVKEDEPLEREVAIDPELLGKAYEKFNAIRPDNFDEFTKALKSGKTGEENKFNKKFGVYYTPREIVHYMCRQSLIYYLHTAALAAKLPIPKKDLEDLIEVGEIIAEHEATAIIKREKIKNGIQKSSEYTLLLPDGIHENAEAIDEWLKDITVCDPAVGSGAFPVGMMNEIVRARNVLHRIMQGDGRNDYEFKRRAIEHSLYGVDIDPGAVEIAKLRLWLSLVVDEDDIKNIRPLPNLDYKIVCGDSLVGVERDMFNSHMFFELEKLKPLFFNETHPTQKRVSKDKIDGLISQITSGRSRFNFEAYFSEVFHEKGGFNITIGNPPYVRQEQIKERKPELRRVFGAFFCGTADLYTYFYKRGLEILNPQGHLCFIAPNKFMRAAYGKNTRQLLVNEAVPKIIIDFGDLPIFDATTYPSILLVGKKGAGSNPETLAATFTEENQFERVEKTLSQIGFKIKIDALDKSGWSLEPPEVLALMKKLKATGVPLGEYVKGKFYRGILTGLNKAFVVDEATKKQLITEDPKSAELIKPWLRGKDIKRWKIDWAGLYLIFTRRGIDIEQYPVIKQYLAYFRNDLEPKKNSEDEHGRKPGTYKWYEIQDNIAYYKEFEHPKIIYPNIAKENAFTFDSTGILTNQKAFIIPTNDLFLLGVLNSKVTTFWFQKTLPLLRGSFYEPGKVFMNQLPIADAPESKKNPVIQRIKKILSNPENPDVSKLENEIDALVYEVYGLNSEDIQIIENIMAK